VSGDNDETSPSPHGTAGISEKTAMERSDHFAEAQQQQKNAMNIG
jgi:hypothetical protein